MKRTKWLSMVFVLCLSVMPVKAAESSPAEDDAVDYTTGTPWLCSILDGNVTADTPALSEDFYLACNKEKLQDMQIPEGYNRYGIQVAVAAQLDEDIKNLFTSDSEPESHDAQLALNLYSLYTD